MIPTLLAILASYLVGSIPNGLLIARSRGIDIRSVGSGNIGATNVFRSVGKTWGILTFAADVLKGFVPAFFLGALAFQYGALGTPVALSLACGCAAIAGHNWSAFLRFTGGKGVATSVGMLLGVVPAAAGIGLASWLVVFLGSGYVSLASVVGAIVIVAVGWYLYLPSGLLVPVTLTVVGVLVVVKHRSNIQRLRQGTENRFNLWGKR